MLAAFLVEDNPLIRENLAAALADLTPVRMVGWAAGENDALAWLAQPPQPWQLAIVDLFLQDGNGLGVLRALHTRARAQRVVVLTNYATADIRARCAALGADAVFDKSSEIDALVLYCQQLAESTGHAA